MQFDIEPPVFTSDKNLVEPDTQMRNANILQEVEDQDWTEAMIDLPAVGARQVRRQKDIIIDENTALRNATMAEWNNEYGLNMARAMKQKLQNRQQTLAKKNAAFWVFGQGIGSVGAKLGMSNKLHPLKLYSGEDLFDAIGGYPRQNACKRTHEDEDEQDRRVRAKEDEPAKHLSRENIDRLNMDVEMGRDAPSSLFDDHSSQMPWNITASIQSSRHRHRYGSVSDLSSRNRNGSVDPRARGRNRLTSASPLAGNGYLAGQEQLDSMDLLGDFGDDLDLTRYLEGELATDRETIGTISSHQNKALKRAPMDLDRESLNFFEFIRSKLEISPDDDEFEGSVGGSPGSAFSGTISTKAGQTTFATLLPIASTTRAVATQGLMNVLTLATKGVLDVHQGPHVDVSTDGLGVSYRYGEILLRLSGM
jgi:meiotic recombination protein REC8